MEYHQQSENSEQELLEKYKILKQRIYQSTRKYALADPERTRSYSRKYYNKNKDDPEFRKKVREQALKSYYKKKEINLANNNIVISTAIL
jgi:hypothetical protein